MPSRDFTNEDLFSSPMISMHSSTHSSQINTVGPAMSLRTSCWLLPQNVQWSGFLVSPLLILLISEPGQDTSHHSRYPTGQSRRTHDREGEHAPMRRRGGCRRPASSIIEEAPERPGSARMLELTQCLGLDLADALARQRELLADLLQRVVLVHADAEAHAKNALLARRQGRQHAGRGFAQVRLDGSVDRQDRVLVLDEIAEVRIRFVADRGFQRQRLPGDLAHLAPLLERHAELLGQLLGRGLAADLVEHLARLTHDFADALHHVDGDADRARLVGDRARDRLPDPPRGIGRELVAAAILEFVDRLHQADIAFLDQVEELQAAVGVFLGDGDDEAQVRLHHLFLGLPRLALALLHHLHDLAELADLEPGLARQHLDLVAVLLDLLLVAGNEALPTLGGELRHPVEPVRIELGALVVLEEILARDAVALGEPHQAAFVADQALVDVVELLDQRVDARLIEP